MNVKENGKKNWGNVFRNVFAFVLERKDHIIINKRNYDLKNAKHFLDESKYA